MGLNEVKEKSAPNAYEKAFGALSYFCLIGQSARVLTVGLTVATL